MSRNDPSYCKDQPNCARNKRRIGITFIETTKRISDPRLRSLCETFLTEWGDRFRRTAARAVIITRGAAVWSSIPRR